MATSDLKNRAMEAFIDDHFELAVDLYTQAIALNPQSAELYSDRAQANIKSNNLSGAVADASKAIHLNPSMSKPYLRKAIACLTLKEYQTAKAALEIGAPLAPNETRFSQLIKECDELIAAENTVISTKDAKPIAKYRHEYYQKQEEVVVTVFAKGISPKDVHVEFGEQILSVSIEDRYEFQPRLFGKIIPKKCRLEVLSTKVEIRLAKADPLLYWTCLEFSKDNQKHAGKVNAPVNGAPRPSYPSSKPKRVDWDKLEAQVKKEEREEKLDGDAALNKFFQDIYRDADEDTKRAMKKSFVESNGTALSTNWKQVGNKKIEGSAPDGMEMKKWEH